MGQLVGGAVGAVVGFFTPVGPYYGWMIGSAIGGAAQGGPKTQGPRIEDNRVQGTEYGQPLPWCVASPRLAGQIAWASPIREIATRTSQGKGSSPKHTSFTYEVDLLIKLTENPIQGISRVWINGDLVWNGTATKAGVWGGITVYTGADDQMPDPTYESHVGAGNAPANRGCGSAVITSLQLGSNGQIPNITFELGGAQELVWATHSAAVGQWPSVTFGNGVYVAVGTAGANRAMTSPDGTTWTGQTGAPLQDWRTVAFGNGVFVALCTSGSNRAMTSNDGINWTLRALDLRSWSGITFGNGYFFAVASSGATRLASSADGITWASGTIPTASWIAINKTPGQFIAVGDAGAVATSPDGAVWTSRTTPTSNQLRGVFFGDELYVAFGASSTILTSPDGITWSARSSPVSTNFNAGIYAGGIYMVFGGSTNSAQSRDGITWTAMVTPESDNRSAILANDTVVVTGASGAVISSRVETTSITESISSVVTKLLQRAGYSDDQFDVSEISAIPKPVRGFAIGQVSSTRSALEVLSTAFFLEWSKTDKIRPHLRPVTPEVTIPFADLGVSESAGGDEEPMALQVGNELEMPAQVSMSYPNTTADYQVSTEHSDRLLSSQESSNQVQMPLGMTPGEAKGIADAILFDQVAGLTKTVIHVGLKYAKVEPGDVINAVNFDGRIYRLRVATKRDSLNVIDLECQLDDVGALVSAGITDDGYVGQTEPRRVAPTDWQSLDIPILRDADDEPGFYVGVAPEILGADDQWPGAVVVRAWSGDDYQQLLETGDRGTLGDCTSTLPDWSGGNVFDEKSTLTVSVWGELESSTRSAMFLDQDINALAIGVNGRWEIVRFRIAELTGTLNGRNLYTLRGFLRGQRGTEWATGTHAAGDRCVLLDLRLRRVIAQTSQIGLTRNMKAVTSGMVLSDVTAEVFTDTGVALKPFSPANPRVLADGGDLVVSWQRRTRRSYRYGGINPVVPLGELAEAYRVHIPDATPPRTVNVTSPNWTYEAADIASDGFSPGEPIQVEVVQLSAIVGEGYPAEATGIAP